MQLFKQSLVIFTFLSLIIACGGKENKAEEEKSDTTKKESLKTEISGPATRLEGAWEIKRAEGDMAELNMGTVYDFKGNKLAFGKDGFNNPGTTEVTDSTFSFQADGNELKFMYDYHFDGDTLVVTMQKGSGQVFHMVKK